MKMTIREAVNTLELNRPFSYSKLQNAIDMAVEALEKQVPKKVIIEPWNPAKCPTCGEELSEDLGDGYYEHYYYLERCSNAECAQRLLW